jgi:hypothetical protein
MSVQDYGFHEIDSSGRPVRAKIGSDSYDGNTPPVERLNTGEFDFNDLDPQTRGPYGISFELVRLLKRPNSKDCHCQGSRPDWHCPRCSRRS